MHHKMGLDDLTTVYSELKEPVQKPSNIHFLRQTRFYTWLTACQSTRIGLKTTYSLDVFFPDYSETQGSYFWISGSHRSQWPSIFLHLLLSCLSFPCHYLPCDREAICLNTVQTTEKVSWPP